MDKERVFLIVCAVAGVSALVLFQHFNTIKARERGKSPSPVFPAPTRPRHSTLSGAHSQSRARSQNVPNGGPRHLPSSHHRGRPHSRPQVPATTATADPSLPGVNASLEKRFDAAADGAGAPYRDGVGGGHASLENHPEARTELLTAQALSRHNQRKDAEGGRYLNGGMAQKGTPFQSADLVLRDGVPRGASANGRQQQGIPWKHVSRSTSVAATDGSKSMHAATQPGMSLEQNAETKSLSRPGSHLEHIEKVQSVSTSPYGRDVHPGSETSKPRSMRRQDPQPENPAVSAVAAPELVRPKAVAGDRHTGTPLPASKMTAPRPIRTEGGADEAERSPAQPGVWIEPGALTPSSCGGLGLSPIVVRPDVHDCSPEGRVVTAMIEESAKVPASLPPHSRSEALESRAERLPHFLLSELEEQVSTILQNLYHTPWKPRLWMLLYSYLKQLPTSALTHLAQCESITSVVHRLERVTTVQPLCGAVEKERTDNDSTLLFEVRRETCAMLLPPALGTSKRRSESHFEWQDKKIVRCRGDSLPKRPAANHSINASTAHPSFHDSLLVFSEAETHQPLSAMTTDADNVMTVLRHFRFLFTEAVETQVPPPEMGWKAAGGGKEVRDVACQSDPDEHSWLRTVDPAASPSTCNLHTPLGSLTMGSSQPTSEVAVRVLETLTHFTSEDAFQKLHRDPKYAAMAHAFTDLTLEVRRILECSNKLETEASNTPERVKRQPTTLKKAINSVQEGDRSGSYRTIHEKDSRNESNHFNSRTQQTRFDAKNQFESIQTQPHPYALISKVAVSPSKVAKSLTPTKPSLGGLRRGLTSHSPSQLVTAGH